MTDVLVDTSVWVAHFKQRNNDLSNLLERDRVLVHPWVNWLVAHHPGEPKPWLILHLCSRFNGQVSPRCCCLSSANACMAWVVAG